MPENMPKFRNKIWLIFLVVLCSCTVTKFLWTKTYTETFSHFLVSRDGDYVIFLGKHYDYIFADDSDLVKEILKWKARNTLLINIERSHIAVNHNNELSGYVIIQAFASNLPEEEYIFLQALGFKKDDRGALSVKFNLSGKRYTSIGNSKIPLPALTHTYIMDIYETSGFFGNVGKITLTPLAITADTVLLVGKVLIAPFRN